MRITSEQRNFIKSFWKENLPDSKVYLFGSRTDDSKRGGDIDLMVLAGTAVDFKLKSNFKIFFDDKFGEQKVDLVSYSFTENPPFKRIALSNAIEL